jgi:hypothetical protein
MNRYCGVLDCKPDDSSEWLATVYQITRRHITHDSSLNIHRHMKNRTSYVESTMRHFVSVCGFNGKNDYKRKQADLTVFRICRGH